MLEKNVDGFKMASPCGSWEWFNAQRVGFSVRSNLEKLRYEATIVQKSCRQKSEHSSVLVHD
jgi:hypothetical protein